MLRYAVWSGEVDGQPTQHDNAGGMDVVKSIRAVMLSGSTALVT
jgi:hypothetical protein